MCLEYLTQLWAELFLFIQYVSILTLSSGKMLKLPSILIYHTIKEVYFKIFHSFKLYKNLLYICKFKKTLFFMTYR